jgi:hypothetical protein
MGVAMRGSSSEDGIVSSSSSFSSSGFWEVQAELEYECDGEDSSSGV